MRLAPLILGALCLSLCFSTPSAISAEPDTSTASKAQSTTKSAKTAKSKAQKTSKATSTKTQTSKTSISQERPANTIQERSANTIRERPATAVEESKASNAKAATASAGKSTSTTTTTSMAKSSKAQAMPVQTQGLRQDNLSLSFPVARDWLYDRSHRIKASEANVRSKQEESDSLKFLGGPTVTAQAVQIAGETKIDIHSDINIPQFGLSMPLGISQKYSINGPRAAVTATLPLYTGGKISAKKQAAKYAVDEASASKREVQEELDAQLAGHYFGLQLAVSVEKLQKTMLDQWNSELKQAIQFEKQGMISKIERMSVEVSKDNAQRDYIKAKDDARVARVQLERLLHDDSFGKLSTPLFVLKRELQPLNYWVDESLANNPQIQTIQAKANQAQQGVKAAKGAWAPDVFAFGQYSFIHHYQTLVEPRWVAGVGLNVTLWSAKDRRASQRSAEATLEQAEQGHEEAINQVRTAAEVAWTKTKNAIEQYKLSASTVTLANENLKLKLKGFGEGLTTAIEVSQARSELLKAEVGRRLAAFEFVSNYAMLHAIAGKMGSFLDCLNDKNDVIFEY